MIDRFKKNFLVPGSHISDILKDSSHALIVNVSGLLCGLLLSIFLGRTLGVEGFGTLSLAVKIGGILLVLCFLGMKQVIVKEVAIGFDNKWWKHIQNVFRTSYLINGGVTIILAIGLSLSAPYLSHTVFRDTALKIPLVIVTLSIIPQIFTKIFSSGLLGLNKIWQSNLVDRTLDYLVVVILLLILWFSSYKVTVTSVAICYLAGRFLIAISVGSYYRERFSVGLTGKASTFIESKLLKTSLPLLLVGASGIIASHADSIMIGWLQTPRQVGLYVVAARVALLTSFLLEVMISAISPRIATLYSRGEYKKMEEMIQKMTALLIVIGLIPFAIFLLGGHAILSIWGQAFSEGFWILLILSAGQFFNLSTGPAGLILMLCGKEKIQGLISVSFLVLNLIMNYFFILHFGALGAALATAISVTAENVTKVLFVKKEFGISTLPINRHYFKLQ